MRSDNMSAISKKAYKWPTKQIYDNKGSHGVCMSVLLSAGLLYGLLLQAVLARLKAQFLGTDQELESEHQDAGEDMASWHLFLQRQEQLCPHHHSAEQTTEDHAGGRHFVLHEVGNISSLGTDILSE